MTKKTINRITDVTPQGENANRHTQRGMAALERSIQADGWIGAITVAADGETFDGSARVEVGGAAFADVEPIIVRSDGSRPVIHIREDIPTADDPRAVKLGLAANRVAQMNLDWEPDVLAAIAAQDIDVSALFTETEWAAVAMVAPSDDEWGAALGALPDGDRAPFQQMTFTVSDQQAETIKRALDAAKDAPFGDTGNENSNGNALARLAEAYLG